MQLAINIIFDQGQIVLIQQVDQLALVLVGHQAAQRVAEIGDQHQRPHRVVFEGKAQSLQADAGLVVGGDFQGTQARALPAPAECQNRWAIQPPPGRPVGTPHAAPG